MKITRRSYWWIWRPCASGTHTYTHRGV